MAADEWLWVDDGLRPADMAHLSARDRGFLLGDGLFETILVRAGRPVRLERHLGRLRAGARVLQLSLPWSDEALGAAIQAVIRANRLGDTQASARLSVSRGVARARGLLFDAERTPTLVIDIQPFAGYPAAVYERGLRALTSTGGCNERLATAPYKTLSNLEHVLARHEAAAKGCDEALITNSRGFYVGASAANLFLVCKGCVVTPSVEDGAVAGTVRAYLLEEVLPALGLSATLHAPTREELMAADEVFLTNALLSLAPVVRVDDNLVGTGCPGPLAWRLRAAIAA